MTRFIPSCDISKKERQKSYRNFFKFSDHGLNRVPLCTQEISEDIFFYLIDKREEKLNFEKQGEPYGFFSLLSYKEEKRRRFSYFKKLK